MAQGHGTQYHVVNYRFELTFAWHEFSFASQCTIPSSQAICRVGGGGWLGGAPEIAVGERASGASQRGRTEVSPIHTCVLKSLLLHVCRAAVASHREALRITTLRAAVGGKEAQNHSEPQTHLPAFGH